MLVRLVLGLLLTIVGLGLAGRRAWWLFRLIRSGQPTGGRTDAIGARAAAQLREVFGQRRLLRWSVPGVAHFVTFWGFVVLLFTIVEAWGALFTPDFAFWWFGRQPWLGFLEDLFTVGVLAGLATFAVIRVRNAPQRKERASRFYGSHTGPAWLVLAMIASVMVTLLLYRAAQVNTGHFPFGDSGWPFASWLLAKPLAGLGATANSVVETVFLLGNIGVIVGFLVLVLHSKHLHIFVAPLNVTTKRLPDALGPLLPMESHGKPIDFDDPGEDDVFGRGKIEDFTWKGMLDFATCTECGRCQSQCPAWNTGKPLSPKLVIMDLRDHLFAKAPYLIDSVPTPEEGSVDIVPGGGHGVPESGFGRVPGSGPDQAARPLVGTAEVGGVIDPEVLWSCTTCGACVEQCPVDIEHVDHIVDLRRYQVMIESEFPSELGTLFRNLENKGNPWGQNNAGRLDWAKDLDFEVPVFDGALAEDVEYVLWVGCAGAFEDSARKTVRATAELLHLAGVNYVVLGMEETCTGDPARRSGNEFLFQMMAQQTVETLNAVFEGREPNQRKIVTTCPHCMNTLGREYPQLAGHYEVVHHTQLLNRLVRVGALTPVKPVAGAEGPTVTYHDPCYLGRHNKVYEPPRELVDLAGATLAEMPRHADRSLCCGAGGARMWMEEKIGKRINLERVDEAIATEAETIVTGCPFCRVMLTDGLDQRQSEAVATNVEVRDVSQLLLESVRRGSPGASAGQVESAREG
ncbi:4Fe-4S dicluster domain-containing protein [Solihabitans fulvus]|uniref:4Fe-4S dicluster domain-containing protein n=2 Tax=Solihabitans fulvus TaxID=1892852 RepID=A0A5B2XUF9_9PSEU|nr:(Fe-S)-binding protein [Solihabitans fulvus]KAA2266572.1 4Fe-4S dicluster domain-containing protein [Solihabitans fulvus]